MQDMKMQQKLAGGENARLAKCSTNLQGMENAGKEKGRQEKYETPYGKQLLWVDFNTPFTRSSKHPADIEQTSSNSTCILNTFARRLLDVCSMV